MDQIVEYEKAKRMSLKSYERQLQAVVSWGGVGSRLKRYQRARFLSCTETQTARPARQREFLSTHIAGAQLLTYGQIGHLPPIETPERFNRDTMEFLA